MSCIITFIQNNLDKLWTIVATLIGASISYKATTDAEKRKEKRTAQKEKLKDVLIPLCSAIEDAMDAMNRYKTIKFKDFDIKIQSPSNFLKAEKRVFLSKKQRTAIKEYDDLVRSFYDKWDEEQKSVLIKYKHWLADKMRECPGTPSALDVHIGTTYAENDMKISVLEKKPESYKNAVTGVTYIINDEPENFRDFPIAFTEEIKTLCGEMGCGISTIDDIDDPEKKIACEVYDFLMRIDDKPAVEKIMSETKTNDNLLNLAVKAKNLRDSLLKDIDKIAG